MESSAHTELVTSNAGLVRAIAARFVGRGLDWDDLVQEGTLGLMRAAEKFDPGRGFRFSTYAHWWIRQGIQRAIADHGRTVRLPVHLNEQLVRLRRCTSRLAQRLGREPTREELARECGLPPQKVPELLLQGRTALSLDAPVSGESETTWADLLPEGAVDPGAPGEQGELRRLLEEAVSNLPPREKAVLRLRFGIGTAPLPTLEQIGRVLGVTRERVRQIEVRALQRLRQGGRAESLEAFLS
jgi:RNA polymerase sigma factor (sigma-70 family)